MVTVKVVSSAEYKATNTRINKSSQYNGASFKSYLGESVSMDKIFDAAADKYNVPVELLKAIGKAESNFDANAVSRSGAQGVMQLMPATARGLGVTDSFDVQQNIDGGSKYIASLLKKYNGDTKLALAAYNAGSGNVEKYGGIPPFKETQNYVKKVMNYMKEADTSGSNINNPNTVEEVVAATINTIEAGDQIKVTIGDSSNGENSSYTYDDYVNFLEKFMLEQKEKGAQEALSIQALKQINYNAPVMNLLNSI